ncbi:MAG TPA: nucleotidyltransferase domain-containing protein [Candidatus Pelethenecus faecipullorum]|uniref:Nucleotidyltransferase domain-containing protein n=1 Tax=Candidatus Pelethenecus faecipullorum TaxID=2840900 RepID=A0A9D1GQ41_9MOLU|nr:nucleotidyltransferase domain-containing protein [Candidatus Pelethenecus faecipullorum]
MEEFLKKIKNSELIVLKKVGKLIEKILRFFELDFSHERFKAVIYAKDEFQTPFEEKMKHYFDAYYYLLSNAKSPFTASVFQRFYYLIFEHPAEENIASKITSEWIWLSGESRITKAIYLHCYVFSLLNDLNEMERWMVSFMMLNYFLVKENIPCLYLNYRDLAEYAENKGNEEKVKNLLYQIILQAQTQKKSYYKQLKKITLEDIALLFGEKQNFIRETYQIEHVFVYGSFAKNTARIDSDIDLLILFKEDISYPEKKRCKEELVRYLTKEFNRYVDIQEIFESLSKEMMIEATNVKKIL